MGISSAVDATALARVVGIKDIFVDLREGVANLPQHIMVLGQGNTAATYATTPLRVFDAITVAETYGFGSPLHLAVLQILPDNGLPGVGTIPVTIFPLEDNVSGIASDGDITMSGTQLTSETYEVIINGIKSNQFAIAEGALATTVAALMVTAIQAVLEMPVTVVDTAGVLEFTSKWKGESANDIFVEVSGPDSGITFVVTQASSGAANPDVDDALDQADDSVWYTVGLNCLNYDDATNLDKFETFGVGRLNSIDNKRMTWWTGTVETDANTLIAAGDARRTDQINGLRSAPGSPNLPLQIAARQIAVTTPIANNNPPVDYGSVECKGIVAGDPTVQWKYTVRDALVKAGISTIKVKDGVINCSDTVTFYHPSGVLNPPYRYLVDIVKISNIIFNISLEFNTPEWDGAPLIPDLQETKNKEARKPKDAKAVVYGIIDSAASNAWISDPDTAKSRTIAGINETNPKRLDIATTMQVSGNVSILSVDFMWGFYYGTAPNVA